MGNNPISNVDPDGDLFWALPNISFDGGFRIGLTVGFGAFSASASYGKGGLQGSVGVGVGPLSASYGSGGFSAGVGYGVNSGGLGLNFGGASYGSGGFGFSGPSASFGHLFTNQKNNQNEKFQVDKELGEIGLNPTDKPGFILESVEKLNNLKSINKILSLDEYDKNIELMEGNKPSKYEKGVVYLSERDFASWRLLATSYGHELVHRYSNSFYYNPLRDAGFIKGTQNKLPYFYDELLAHTFSTSYSGINKDVPDRLLKLSKSKYPGVVEQFYSKQKIMPYGQ